MFGNYPNIIFYRQNQVKKMNGMSKMLYSYKVIRKMKLSAAEKIVNHYAKNFDHTSPLFEFIMDDEKIFDLIYTASEGKRGRLDVIEMLGEHYRDKEYCLNNKDTRMYRSILFLRIMVLSRSYEPSDFTHHSIKDGNRRKSREILVPDFAHDLLTQYLAVEIIKPIIFRIHYNYSCASFPGKGRIYAKNYIEGKIRQYRNPNVTEPPKSDPIKYYMKLDIRHFFPSIKHRILKKKFKKYIRDKEILGLIFKIIDSTDFGIPIGFYSSQWFANFLLTDLDHYIKERIIKEGPVIGYIRQQRAKRPGVEIYCRYMDDMVLFGSDKNILHRIKNEISTELDKLGLELKKNWTVEVFDHVDYDYVKEYGRPSREERKEKPRIGRAGHALDFIGYRFFREYTILRRSTNDNVLKFLNKLKKRGGRLTLKMAYQLISYYGLLKHTDNKLYEKEIIKVVRVKDAKRIIRAYQHYQNMKLKEHEIEDTEDEANSDTEKLMLECKVEYLHSVSNRKVNHTGMLEVRKNSQYFKEGKANEEKK